jgi:hypothetical protein
LTFLEAPQPRNTSKEFKSSTLDSSMPQIVAEALFLNVLNCYQTQKKHTTTINTFERNRQHFQQKQAESLKLMKKGFAAT